jgi:putative tryptophan/tyrosine transport system substrate-binding protein
MAIDIARRKFVAALGGAAFVWPLTGRAQQPGKLPTIGFLASGTQAAQAPLVATLLQRLRELGWTEGRTVAIEIRWAEGRRERADEIANEFARLKVDVFVTSGAVNILAAKRAAPATPIVFAVTADPVGAGLVTSLARPGGNITGLSSQGTDYAGKQIDLLRSIVPGLHHLAVMANVDSPGATAEMHAFATTAQALGFELSTFQIRQTADIAPAFEALKGRVDALDVVPDPFVVSNRIRFITLALATRVPTIYGDRQYPDAGGLMSFGPNLPDLYRRAAEFVDKILRGMKPGDIPVEQPTKFDLVINLTTAKALGLNIPPSLLATADDVIE